MEIPFRGPSWSLPRSDIHTAIPSLSPRDGMQLKSFMKFIGANVPVKGLEPFGQFEPDCILTIEAPVRRVAKSVK